jgi:hypothetical protein
MRTRSPFLAPVVVFATTFALAFTGGFFVRKNRGTTAPVVIETIPIVESTTTTAPPLGLETTTTPQDTEKPTEATAPPTTTEAPTTEPPVVRPEPQLTTDNAVFGVGSEGDRRLFDPAAECASLSRSLSDTDATCLRATIGDENIAWVIQSDNSGVDVLTLDPSTPDVYVVRLRSDRTPVRAPRLADVTGDGIPELVTGWRDDANNTLELDVVEFRSDGPVVSLHLSLDAGSASAGDGQLDAWNAFRDDNGDVVDFDHWTYRKTDQRWVVDRSVDEKAQSGQF